MTPCDPAALAATPGVQRGAAYAADVLAGRVLAGKKVIAACRRFEEDWARAQAGEGPWAFDPALAERPIAFMERFLRPSKGAYTAMRLMGWQCFALMNVFGFISRETRLRRFRECLIYVGSGNGKSTLMSGLSAFMASKDGERGADVCLFANSRAQAGIIFEECKRQIAGSPELAGRFRVLRDRICYDPAAGQISSYASDSGKLDGLNPHAAIFDEIHEFGDFRLVDIVKRKFVKRKQPLCWYLTTAGYVNEGPLDYYYRLFSDALSEGKLEAAVRDRLFCLIYELDEGDAVEDESNWVKANPSLGVLLDAKELHNAWATARHIPQERADFICKNLNLKVNADEASFVDWSVLLRNKDVIDLAELEGYEAYAGFDLSTREDFTAAAVVAPLRDGREFVLHHSWVPRRKVETSPEGADFYSWAMQGLLTIVEGDYIEQDQVAEWILRQAKFFDLLSVGYDPANARWTVLQLQGKGVNCEIVRQGPITLNDPMKDLKEMLLAGRVVSNNDPMLRWYTDNVRISKEARHMDKANWMPVKRKRTLKIDGFMAWLFAHTQAMRAWRPPINEEDYQVDVLAL